jgi:hypothetical protein
VTVITHLHLVPTMWRINGITPLLHPMPTGQALRQFWL